MEVLNSNFTTMEVNPPSPSKQGNGKRKQEVLNYEMSVLWKLYEWFKPSNWRYGRKVVISGSFPLRILCDNLGITELNTWSPTSIDIYITSFDNEYGVMRKNDFIEMTKKVAELFNGKYQFFNKETVSSVMVPSPDNKLGINDFEINFIRTRCMDINDIFACSTISIYNVFLVNSYGPPPSQLGLKTIKEYISNWWLITSNSVIKQVTEKTLKWYTKENHLLYEGTKKLVHKYFLYGFNTITHSPKTIKEHLSEKFIKDERRRPKNRPIYPCYCDNISCPNNPKNPIYQRNEDDDEDNNEDDDEDDDD